MKKRFRRKSQKEMGYVSIGAWVRPELREALAHRAAEARRSMSAEMVMAVERHLELSAEAKRE